HPRTAACFTRGCTKERKMKYITPNWPAPSCIKAYTTTRYGWGGREPYHDSHQGFYTANNTENEKLKSLLHLPNEPIWLKQTHSVIVIEALPQNKEQVADAAFSTEVNQVCVVLTADCLPIL